MGACLVNDPPGRAGWVDSAESHLKENSTKNSYPSAMKTQTIKGPKQLASRIMLSGEEI